MCPYVQSEIGMPVLILLALYRWTEKNPQTWASPHFSQTFYCGGAEGHVYCVALPQTPRRTVQVRLRGLQSRALYPRPSALPRDETL